MDSQNQFTVFLLCVLIGFVGGVLYEPIFLLRRIFGCKEEKRRVLGGVFDCLFFIVYAVFCVFAAYLCHFPAFRGYMWIGFALGGGLYAKSLRRILAFCFQVCYNKVSDSRKKTKEKKKLEKSGE